MLKTLLKPKLALTTIMVIFAIAVMARLGIWQLDRLEQRRAFNIHYIEQANAAPLEVGADILDHDLENMEYRRVFVSGEYDHIHEVAIRNQAWDGRNGVHLLTPLRILESENSVLVDRGWIPLEAYKTGNWEGFAEPGTISVSGIIRISQAPTIGGRPDATPVPGESLRAWNFVNIPEISKQVPYPLLPVYIQQSPGSASSNTPIRSQPDIEIDEGPHLGYAIQWFIFAAILAGGYPIFLYQEYLKLPNKNTRTSDSPGV